MRCVRGINGADDVPAVGEHPRRPGKECATQGEEAEVLESSRRSAARLHATDGDLPDLGRRPVVPGPPREGPGIRLRSRRRLSRPWPHVDAVMTSLSRVTEALRAMTRPSTVTRVFTWTEVRARMLPRKLENVPRVAELPIFQKALQDRALPSRLTLLLDAVTRVDAVWKMKTPLGLPWAFRVSVPVIWNVPEEEL